MGRNTLTTAAAPPATARTGWPAAGAVLTGIRRGGPVFRDQLVADTGLSHATVNRQVTALLSAGLLRERTDLVRSGAVGRPRVPVEVTPDVHGVLGLHIGLRRTTLAAADLRGRVLGAVEVPNPSGDRAEVISLLTRRLRAFGARWPERRVLRVGLVVGGQLSADRAWLHHPALGWDRGPVTGIVDRVVDSDVVVTPQLEAMAGADEWFTAGRPAGSTLYVYAREAVGAVLVHRGPGGDTEIPATGPGTISHLPVGGAVTCRCGRTGCLEASVADAAVAAAARRARIVPEESIDQVVAAATHGDTAAHDLLTRRARLLGRGVAMVRDVLNPDRVVLLGQAFTGYRPAVAHVMDGFAANTVLEPLTPLLSPLGPGLQALAACTAALRPVFADPLGTVRKVEVRHGRPAHDRPGRVAGAR